MNEWIGRAFRGAIVGAALMAALVVYSLFLAPRIDPRSDRPPLDYSALDAGAYVHVTPVGVSPVAASPEIFAPGEWELESPKTLQTSHGTLFFREYRIESTGELSVAPITMIFPVEDATGVRNLLVRAPDGGRLRFTEKIDLASGKIGKIEGGRLIGKISMTMEETSPGAGDSFDLTTTDVQIDRKLLSTPHEVAVRYGPHTAIGSDLVINFREDGDEGEAFAAHEALQHVASLELAHVEEVNIDLDAPGLFGDEPADPNRPREPQGTLEIHCTKGFALNLDLRTAQFDDNVEVIRLLAEGGTSDSLTCQRLQIEFDEFPDRTNPAAKPKLGAKRIAAIGLPAMAHVRSRDLEAKANVMSYDVPSRTLSLRDDTEAWLSHQGRRIASPEIVYSIPEGNGLGTGTIAGPGSLQATLDGETPRPVQLFWTDQAQLVKQNGEHVVSLVGGARIIVDNGLSTASADRVDFWLKEIPKAERPLAANVPADQANPLGSISVKPLRFMAKGRVALDSPEIAVRTPQLEAWFQELEGAAPAGGGDAGIGVFGSKGVDPAAKRYSLQGDLVRLQMLRRGEEWDLAELFIQGAVDFRETQPPGQGTAKPLAVTSQGLHWRRTPGANETLRIWGEEAQRIPAIVDSESMRLEGPAIDVDRTQSLIQVIGEGRMRLRGKVGSVSPLGDPSVAVPGAGSEPQWVTIAWKESFSAAGREATFRQDVKTMTDQMWAIAPTLIARFDRPIDLMNTEFEAPKVESLAFEGGIVSENRSMVSGELRSIDRFQAQSLEIAPESGAFVARGPAWISSVRLGTEGLPGQQPGLTPQVGPKTLQYFYVECQTGFEGDYLKRTVGFIDRTVALFAPAPNWEVQYRPSDGAALPEKAVTLRCDRLDLRHVPTAPGPSPTYFLEADAVGNARLESKQQNADAQKISFNESKDLITLEGDGRNDVRLESTKSDGSKTVAKMRKVYFWRSENRIKGEDYSGGEYNAANDPRAGL